MKSKFYANSVSKQDLSSHLIGVAKRAVEIASDLGIKNEFLVTKDQTVIEAIKKGVVQSGLLHDIGKVSKSFQDYIVKKKEETEADEIGAEADRAEAKGWHGIHHQEISWAFSVLMCDGITDQALHSVYWHHKAIVNENGELARPSSDRIKSGLLEGDEAEVFEDMKNYLTETLKRAAGITEISNYLSQIRLGDEKSFDIAVPEHFSDNRRIGTLTGIESHALKFITLSIMMEADRQISSISSELLESYLENRFSFENAQNNEFLPKPHTISARDIEQQKLADLIAQDGKVSIVAVDTGAGKTSISLRVKSSLNSGRKTIFILPERMQVDAMFSSVKEDYLRIFGEEAKSLQSAHSGQVQATTSEEVVMGSQFNILVFDRVISSFYNRGRFSEMMQMFRSDVIVDEFHKFTQLQNMWISLATILTIRSWLNAKTMLLSATPDIALITSLMNDKELNKVSVYNRDLLAPVYEESFAQVKLAGDDMIDVDFSEQGGCLRTFNKISECQSAFYEATENDFLIHSQFEKEDKKRISELVLTTFGKNNHTKTTSDLYSAKTLQASFNISRPNAVIPICLPFETPQELGRWARFGEVKNGLVYLKENTAATKDMYSENVLGYRDLFLAYHKFVTSKVGSGIKVNKRGIMVSLFDDFWKTDELYEFVIDAKSGKSIMLTPYEINEKYISRYFREARENMTFSFPKKYSGKFSKLAAGKSGKSALRGSSFFVSAKKVDIKNGLDNIFVAAVNAENCIDNTMTSEIAIDERRFNAILETVKLGSDEGKSLLPRLLGDKWPQVRRKLWLLGRMEFPVPSSSNFDEVDSLLREKIRNTAVKKKNLSDRGEAAMIKEKYYCVYSKLFGLIIIKSAYIM